MKRHSFSIFITAFLITAFSFCFAQTKELNFSLISIEQGLSQSTVFSILQDKRGFMWFGTNDGLNKFDGYKITVYKPDPTNPNSLSGNRVFTIFEDSKGSLWIGTDGGLNKFNREKENFYHYNFNANNSNSLPDNHVTCIKEDKEGTLWIGTNNGLAKFNTAKNLFTIYKNDPSNKFSISNNYIRAIYNDKNGVLWIGTDSLLNKFNTKEEKFYRFNFAPDEPKRLAKNTIFAICEDSAGYLWVGSRSGLNRFDKKNNTFIHLQNSPANQTSLGNDNVYSLLIDKAKNLWVGTLGGGLDKVQNKNKAGSFSFSHFYNNPQNSQSLSNNYVWSIYEDRTGALWVGTDIGLNKYDPQVEKFILYRNNPFNKNSLCNNVVTSIFEDKAGLLWIGTIHGLDIYDGAKMQFTHLKSIPGNKNSISNNYIRSIFEDRNGIIWIGTNGGGLNRYDKKTKSFRRYVYDPLNNNSLCDDKVISICQDKEGILWLGTLGGLNKFDPVKEQFTRYKYEAANNNSLSHNYIFTLFEDSRGGLWIGTNYGLNRFDKKSNTFTRYYNKPNDANSLSNNLIMSIIEDRSGALWIGTNGGLNKFDRASQKFIRYTEKDVLSNDVIYGILEDNSGCLWLSTIKGLSKFDPRTKITRNYTKEDGLQSNQFSTGAYYKNGKGKLFFGGINGMNEFRPENIIKNTYIPPIVFTDFQISNKSINQLNSSLLSKSISETEEIYLPYKENVFSFEFAALNYTLPQENEYAYMMEGFDKDWIKSGNRRFVTYTNLDPGKYVFKVKGANNDGVWNDKGIKIAIIISPPFWKTIWFILLAAVIVFSVISWIVASRMKTLLTVERVRFNIASDLHDDLGTHLTEISMLSDSLYSIAQNNSDLEKELIQKIGNIARRLIDNMSDIVWLINPKRDSITELFLKLKDNFEEFLSFSNIFLHFDDLEFLDKIKLPMEHRKNLYLIFKEAMNNSVKHSGCTNIWIKGKVEGRHLEIILQDDGKGIVNKNNYKGNGLANMKERALYLKGTISISSSPSIGTIIQFRGKI